MSADILRLLEFPELLALVSQYAGNPLGRLRVLELVPGQDRERIQRRLDLAAEAIEYLRAQAGSSSRTGEGGGSVLPLDFGSFADPADPLSKLSVEGSVLEPLEIVSLLRFAQGALEIRRTLLAPGHSSRRRFPRLCEVAGLIADFDNVVRAWIGKFLPNGDIDDRATPQLQRIRREIERQRGVILGSLRSLGESLSDDDSSQEIVTVRGDRFVIPVRAHKKSQVKGVVHGTSSSGQSVYMEPLETIELNNELVRWREEEAAELHRILREATHSLHERAIELAGAAAAVGTLDLAFASARFAEDYRCVIPQFDPQPDAAGGDRLPGPLLMHSAGCLLLKEARHPLLESWLRPKRVPVVPQSLDLEGDTRVLVISGPNTGGKTVTLKTVGLLALMAMAGLPVPAVEATLPFFDRILADIGDSQSIQESLSTFSAHLLNIASMLESATGESLILLDELGTATDPEEAGALAVAVVERFRTLGAYTLASTHHTALKSYATQTPGVCSAHMGFDEQTLAPTYRLEVGRPGSSSGISIAEILGLPAEVIARARQALSTAHREAEQYLSRLRQEEAAAARLERELSERVASLEARERQWSETQRRKEEERAREWERQLESLLATFEQRAEQRLRELAVAVPKSGRPPDAAKRAAQAVSRLREQAHDELRQTVVAHLSDHSADHAGRSSSEPAQAAPALGFTISPRKAFVGDTVKLNSLGRAGVVRGKADNWLEVEVGRLRTRVSYDDISEVIPAASMGSAAPAKPSSVHVHMETATHGSLSEINVIGENAEDARRRVDKFLDNAFLAQISRVRVIHGSGKGILRKSLAEMFAEHPHVEKFSLAPQAEGGAGATIVELKN